MDDTRKKRLIAEVRFLRACQYFYLSQHFRSVPLVTKTLTPEEANTVFKAPRPEIVNFVIKEFASVVLDLPRFKDIPPGEIGRASKQAALAFCIYITLYRHNKHVLVYGHRHLIMASINRLFHPPTYSR